MVDARAIGARQADREHSAHRMPDQVEAVHMETIEQRDGRARHIVETVSESGLGRLAETDLVRGHDPITGLGQRLDGGFPIARREIPAMQKDDCPPVRRPDWRRIHIGKAQILALKRYRHEMDGIRVRESFKRDAHRLGADRLRGESNEQGHGDEQTMGKCAA